MSLQRGKYAELPPDAVVLTEEEALKYQTNILNKWKKPADIFGYKYGAFILGGASFFTGLYINSHFRLKFKLLHYGRVATYLPVCILPAAFSALTHAQFVLKDVVLQKTPCPVCVEMRGASIQALVGCAFPFALSILANLSMAQKYLTYDIPDITSDPRKVFNLVSVKTRPIGNILFGIFIGQALIGSIVTYLESKSVITVNTKLAQLEMELENNL